MKQKCSRTDRWPRTRGQPHDYVQKGNPAGLPCRLPGMLMTSLLAGLNDNSPNIKIDIVPAHKPEKHELPCGPIHTSREQFEQLHKWLTRVDEFADFIQNVKTSSGTELVTIVLIDDGVDIDE